MTKFNFTDRVAKKEKLPLRLMFWGVSGGGKTYSALELAQELKRLDNDDRPIRVLDTEKSAEKYADVFQFRHTEAGPNGKDGLLDHHPEMFAAWINHWGPQSSVLVIDSLTHEWEGVNGCLQLAEDIANAKYRGNSYVAWGEVRPMHNKVIQAIIACPSHIIVTSRSKQEYVLETRNGKQVPVKAGMGHIGEKSLAYEFDVVLTISNGGNIAVDKTRSPVLQGRVFNRDVPTLAHLIHGWLNSGEAVERYTYADGTEAKNHPATRRIFGEFVAEFDRVPQNSDELRDYHQKRTSEESANVGKPDLAQPPETTE